MKVIIIIQFIAHKNNLPHMFQDPMLWCEENIDTLSMWSNEENYI